MNSLTIDELETKIEKLNVASLRAIGRAAGVENAVILRIGELRKAILSIAKGETDSVSVKEEHSTDDPIADREITEAVLTLWKQNRKNARA